MGSATGGSGDGIGIGVIGVEHLHLFELVDGLVLAGCRAVAHAGGGPLGDAYAAWRPESRSVTPDDVLADPEVDLVVLAGVPATRAATACAALAAGKDVLSDKPGATTAAQLDDIRAAIESSGRRWWVLFSERFGTPAVVEAVALARSGRIGTVVAVQGSAPHRGSLDLRPDWFFDGSATGGILVDLGSHQADQFLALTGSRADDVEVVAAAAGNVGAPDRPRFEDIGEMVLATSAVRGHHRVDYLEPDGFPTWGDVRLVVTGTAGRIEVRIPVAGGQAGPTEVWVTDADGVFRHDHAPSVTWPADLLADRLDGGERLMSRRHPFDVTALTLRAAAAARPWATTGPTT